MKGHWAVKGYNFVIVSGMMQSGEPGSLLEYVSPAI